MSLFDKFLAPKDQAAAQGSTTNNPNGAAGQSTTSGTTLTIGGPNGITTTLPNITVTPQQIQQILSTFQVGLTKEEQEELDRLNVEHTQEIKSRKIAAFKKLAPDMRQFVINALTWNEHLEEMRQVTVEKSPRLLELEQKKNYGNLFGQSSQGQWYVTSAGTGLSVDLMQSFVHSIGLPEGITADDLKQAHVEATMEEEMLDGEKA